MLNLGRAPSRSDFRSKLSSFSPSKLPWLWQLNKFFRGSFSISYNSPAVETIGTKPVWRLSVDFLDLL